MKKDFNDFLSTIDKDALEPIINKVNFGEDSLKEIVVSYFHSNIMFSVELLQRYHDWLNE